MSEYDLNDDALEPASATGSDFYDSYVKNQEVFGNDRNSPALASDAQGIPTYLLSPPTAHDPSRGPIRHVDSDGSPYIEGCPVPPPRRQTREPSYRDESIMTTTTRYKDFGSQSPRPDLTTYKNKRTVDLSPKRRPRLEVADVQDTEIYQVDILPYEPDGDLTFRVKMAATELRPLWNQTIYSWHSNGTGQRTKNGSLLAMVENKTCCGIFECETSSCILTVRVPSRTKKGVVLPSRRCSQCSGTMIHKTCSATFKTIRPMSGKDFLIEFRGYHHHESPPNGKLNHPQSEAAGKVFRSQPNATPSQLKRSAGLDENGDSQSIDQINPIFSNPCKISYQRRKMLNGPGSKSTSAGNSESWMIDWDMLHEEFPEWIKHSNIKPGERVIVMQSTEMESYFSKYEVRTQDQNGYVSDAAHAFFRNGLLLVSCAFDHVCLRWVPVVFSYLGSQTKEAYAQHFRVLFRSIYKAIPNCEDYYYTNVVDFSQAQNAGYVLAFVQHMEETEGWWEASRATYKVMNKDADLDNDLDDNGATIFAQMQEVARKAWAKRGTACLLGCQFHWRKSVVRVKNNINMISLDHTEYFEELTAQLLTCDAGQFESTVLLINRNFPAATFWLDWWIRTANATLIFDCKKHMAEEFRGMHPKTSNAVESLHKNIYNACGINQATNERFSLLRGIRVLHQYERSVARDHFNAAKGHTLRYGEAQRSRGKAQKYGAPRPLASAAKAHRTKLHHNDGRSVDSTEKLVAARTQKQKADVLANSLSSDVVDGVRFLNKHRGAAYQSTPLQANSCFLDSLIEVMYFIYIGQQKQWDRLLKQYDTTPSVAQLLGTIFWQALRTRSNTYQEADIRQDLVTELGSIRNDVRSALVGKGCVEKGAQASTARVFHDIMKDSPAEIRGLSTTTNLKFAKCEAGHVEMIRQSSRESITLPPTEQLFPGETKSITQIIIDHLGPFLHPSPDEGKEKAYCKHSNCALRAKRHLIATSIPEILLVEEQSPRSNCTPVRYTFPAEISLDMVSARKSSKIQYTLVGRTEFMDRHYTALVRSIVRGEIYEFDSITGKGTPLDGKKSTHLNMMTGSRPAIGAGWYILDSAANAQSEHIRMLQAAFDQTDATLEYDKSKQEWNLRRDDFAAFLVMPAKDDDIVMVDRDLENTAAMETDVTSDSDVSLPTSIHPATIQSVFENMSNKSKSARKVKPLSEHEIDPQVSTIRSPVVCVARDENSLAIPEGFDSNEDLNTTTNVLPSSMVDPESEDSMTHISPCHQIISSLTACEIPSFEKQASNFQSVVLPRPDACEQEDTVDVVQSSDTDFNVIVDTQVDTIVEAGTCIAVSTPSTTPSVMTSFEWKRDARGSSEMAPVKKKITSSSREVTTAKATAWGSGSLQTRPVAVRDLHKKPASKEFIIDLTLPRTRSTKDTA